MVLGDQLDDAPQRADLDRIVVGHRHVELTIDVCGQADVRSILPDFFVTERSQCLGQIGPGHITRPILRP